MPLNLAHDDLFAQAILAERTRQLAAPLAQESGSAERQEFLVVPIADAFYALPATATRAVIPMRPFTRPLGGPRAMMGLFSDNGHLIAALDLAEALGFQPLGEAAAQGHLVILRGHKPQMALAVQRAARMLALPASAVVPEPGESAVIAHADVPAGALGAQPVTLTILDPKRLIAALLPSSARPTPSSGA